VTLGGIALSAAAVSWALGSWMQDRAAAAGMRRTLVTIGAAMIGAGIGITALVLLPDAPVLVAAVGWGIAGLGMGLAYSMLALLMLETSALGEEGFSSAALQLMFTLGTAFGAGVGGAVVALADEGRLELPPALAVVDVAMLVVAAVAVLVSLRVPRDGAAVRRESPMPQGVPLEHP
jgi:MFS family permease